MNRVKKFDPERRRIKKAVTIGEILGVHPTLKRMGVLDGDRHAAIFSKWEEIVGQAVARNTQPLKFNRGTLTVAVSSAAWLHNLSMMKPQILANLDRAMGKNVVQEIRFKAAGFDMEKFKA